MKTKVKTKTNIKELLTTEELKKDYSYFWKFKLFLILTISAYICILIAMIVSYAMYKDDPTRKDIGISFIAVSGILLTIAITINPRFMFTNKYYANIKNVLAYLYAKTNLKRFKHWFRYIFLTLFPYTYKKHRNEWLELVEKYKNEKELSK